MPNQAPPRQVVHLDDFPGLSSDPRGSVLNKAPGAATEQLNCVAINQGELRVRQGVQVVRFDEE